MKFTWSWLTEHLDTDASVGRVVDTLTMIGLEVEAVTDPGAGLREFVVARVVSAAAHPNADRLRVCQVDAGAGVVQVVCGAPNARAGMTAVFAPPGSVIPATGAVLGASEIRGVASRGMLLSAREMGLGQDHDGIVELAADAPVGVSYPAHAGLDDALIDVAITPNRGDALSVRGIARDLAAAGIGTLKPWSAPAVASGGPGLIAWRNDFPAACPYILGRTVRGVRNGPSPAWLARRLMAVGLRPISALVDITNYIAIDLGRPLHVFDAGRVRGGVLTVRRGRDEEIAALDGKTYVARAEDCVIADDAGAQSLGGLIGGVATSCGEATSDVFIECALFDPVRIALSGRAHQINTEARARFERGVDPALVSAGLDAATAMVVRLCGGTACDVVEAGAPVPWRRAATLSYARLNRVVGAEIAPREAISLLERLGFAELERDAGSVTMRVPSWRTDIVAPMRLHPAAGLPAARLEQAAVGCREIEPQVDLIEEVLRLHGIDRIPPVSLPTAGIVPQASLGPRQTRTALARRVLAARGLLECVTFSFTDAATAKFFGGGGIALANPIAADLDHLRPTPLATLARASARNAARGFPDTGLFEVGPGFSAPEEDGQHRVAAAVRSGKTPRTWREATRAVDAFDAKADALAVLSALGAPMDGVTTTRGAPGHYHPGRAGTLRQGPKLVLGYFGALHPALCAALDLPADTVAMEVMLDAIAGPKRRRKAAPVISTLMPVRRDFAFVAGDEVEAEKVLRAAKGADRALIAAVALFDVYPLADGTRSIGVEVVLQPVERTLNERDLEEVSARIVGAVFKATGARLREAVLF